jgi:hypothetical protein
MKSMVLLDLVPCSGRRNKSTFNFDSETRNFGDSGIDIRVVPMTPTWLVRIIN